MAFDNLDNFFSDFLVVHSNPYELISFETLKENGTIKTKQHKQTIELIEVSSPIELILNNGNFQYIDYYPNSFLKKIFNIKNDKEMNFTGNENNFVLMSKKTAEIFKTNCKVHLIEEDDKVIIGNRSLLITYQSGEKSYAWCDVNNFKTIIIR
jgi:hypothetical protein